MPPPWASWALVVIFSTGENKKKRDSESEESRGKKVEGKKVAVEKPVVEREEGEGERGMEERVLVRVGRQFAHASAVFDRVFPSRAASEPTVISGLESTRIGGEQGGHQQGSFGTLYFFLSRPRPPRRCPQAFVKEGTREETCCFLAAFLPSHGRRSPIRSARTPIDTEIDRLPERGFGKRG